MKKVSIIIVNHNGKHLLKACLESLYKQSFKDIELIVVDNASEDGSVEYVQDSFPDVKLVSLPKNIGFAGANVEGFKYAKGDYILLLNNDIEVDKDCIRNLVHVIEAEYEVGIGATKMVVNGKEIIDSVGDGFSTTLRGFKRGEGRSSRLYNSEEYVFGACAGAAIYRRTMLEDIGFLDEDFFLIYEDTDLNLRAQLAGWRVKYVPSAIVYHKVRSTIGHMSDGAVYYALRNSELTRIKNMPLGLFLYCFPSYFVGFILEFLYFVIKHGKLSLYLKAKIDVIKLFPAMLKKRKDIMNNKKVDNKYLYSVMTPLWNKDFFTMKVKKFLHGEEGG